jgi:hypothetical protein
MMRRILSVLLLFVAGGVGSLVAQLSQAGAYSATVGTNDVFITIGKKTAAQLLLIDRAGRTVDLSSLSSLNASDSVSGVTIKGRQYSFQVRDSVARGTLGGVSFTAAKEPIFGAFYARSGGYSGVFQEDNLTTHVASITIFPSGKVMILQSNSLAERLGFGQINQFGQITASMSDGAAYSLSFNPNPELWLTANGDVFSNGRRTYSYVMFGAATSRMPNIATRGVVSSGAPMIAGFVVTQYAKTVLIRGVGPTLASFGVTTACPDTQISLFSGQTVIAANQDWGQAANPSEAATAASFVGAFPLATGGKDAAMLVTLEPGPYTVLVGPQGAVGGEALVEVYEVN